MNGAAAAVLLLATSCAKDLYEPQQAPVTPSSNVVSTYNTNFVNTFGQPAANQNWGFGAPASARMMTRSFEAPACPGIEKPYDEAWVAEYLTTAKEPNATNVWDNYDNSSYQRKDGTYVDPYYTWYSEFEALYPTSNYNWDWNKAVAAAQAAGWEHWDDLFSYNADETFVLNFKITGTWDGGINVAGSEGSQNPGCERTVVVTGTWNITENQRIGSLGKIIIANGGTVNVASGVMLNMVNQARLVVLPGGKLTGAGSVEVNNGNAVGLENYNGGTIDVATFNNNFGKFYNYGDFLVNEYHGGAQESNFYNHHLAAIDHFAGNGSTANARIFNACQFYVKNNARIRNYEGVGGSSLIVDGQLMFSGSEDGTSDPTSVGLAAGALVQCATLYNNGTSWRGPLDGGYAALNITDKIEYLNWEQDHPEQGGYFANNIYVVSNTWDNVPDGNGYHQTDPSDTENHAKSIASYKFNYIANSVGNGNVKIVEKGNYEVIPADADFKKGEAGCTPGFKIKKEDTLPSLHVMAEDLSASEASDFDFNDVVIDVFYVDENTVNITLLAAGGTLPLRINEDNNWEVHKLFDVDVTCMVNTGTKYHKAKAPYSQTTKPYVYLTLEGKTWSKDQYTFAEQVRDQIKLEVYKENRWYELKATAGTPAGKIATSVDIYMKDYDWYPNEYRWPWEKQNIGNRFQIYVGDPEQSWYETKTQDEEE